MPTEKTSAHAFRVALLAIGVYAVAVWARWLGAPIANVLGDSLGPWWTAFGLPTRWEGHSPIYGWASGLPHALLLPLATSLDSAIRGLLALHALAAPIVVLVILRLRAQAWLSAALAGLLVALDPGLIETALSGHKGYLAPVWVGLITLGVVYRRTRWGAILACVAAACAIQTHPLATASLPFVALLDWRGRRARIGGGLGALLLVPFVHQVATQPLTTDGGTQIDWTTALPAFLQQGGGTAGLILTLPLLVAFLPAKPPHPQHEGPPALIPRNIARCTLLAFTALFVIGISLGYLRDHHLRLLTIPALACLSGLCTRWIALAALAFRLPAPDLPAPDHPHRPGTLALTTQITDALPQRGTLMVDGIWLSSTPAAEPSGVMLDRVLRGGSQDALGPGDQLILIVSGERVDLAPYRSSARLLQSGDRHVLLQGTTESLKPEITQLCETNPRLGGAGDALGVFRPDLRDDTIRSWHAPCNGG